MLYPRLIGGLLPENEPHIPVHQFMAALGELERGNITQGNIATAFVLDASEQVELATLVSKILTPMESISIGSFVQITNVGTTYDAVISSQGLGSVRVQLAGINRIEFGVRTNKAGSGTQDWQLWNETDAAEVALVSDAGATGVKNLPATVVNYAPALSGGFKLLRIRAKSSTGADDPAFMGASLAIQRTAKLTSVEIHEVLLMAEYGIAYNTEALLKARLGV